MAPKKVKTTQPPAEAPEAKEERPLAFEDLPNDVLSVILRKLKGGKFKISLTQASPSVRRLSSGPNAHPDVLGPLSVFFSDDDERAAIDLDLFPYSDLSVIISAGNPDFPSEFPAFLSWLKSKSKALESVAVFTDEKRDDAKQVLSILRALSEASFSGNLELYLSDVEDPRCLPIFEFLRSCSNPVSLWMRTLELQASGASDLFKSLTALKEVTITDPVGEWSPEFFSTSTDLESLTIVNCSDAKNFCLPPSPSLRHFQLGGGRSFLSPTLSSALHQLQALRVLKLGVFLERRLNRLSVLSSLESLVSFHVTVFKDLALPFPPPPSFRLHLPHLEYLVLTVELDIDSENHEAIHNASFPLGWLSCPELRLLKLRVDKDDAVPGRIDIFEGTGITISVGSLAHFPALRCLCLKARSNFLFGCRTLLRFNVRTDFRTETPELAFFSYVAQACTLPPPPRMFSLPVSKTVSIAMPKGEHVISQLDCGDRRVLDEMNRSPDFPWHGESDSDWDSDGEGDEEDED